MGGATARPGLLVSDTGQAKARAQTSTDGSGPPVSDTERGGEEDGTRGALSVGRGRGQWRRREGGASGADGWPEGHGTAVKHRRRPSPMHTQK
jgi:hypothetical protein